MRNRVLGVCAVLLVVPLAVALIAVTASPVWGQATNTGTILGSVYDNSNAFVPGATVTITQTTTGATRTTTTDKSGRFVFADVDPGTYSVRVSKQGFSTAEVANQAVQIGTQLTENIQLLVGAITTTVEVTENPGAELQTMNATVGTTLSGSIIFNLPNAGRDASSLAVLQPGQNINGNVGGVASDQNSFQLDGGYATDDMSGDNNTYIASFASDTAGGIGAYHSSGYSQVPSAVVPVPVASIEEFKISTANQTADFNGGAGSEMQLETKRGTNTFHGGAYEYYEDNDFGGANTWDNNDTATPNPSSHNNRFGWFAGGKIPRSNFLGGDWFVFGLYEGYRFPNNSIFEEDYPLPSLRAGIIHTSTASGSQTINLNNTAVVDPGCGAATNGCLVTTTGQTIQPTLCPAGPCDPRGLGPNPVITNLWSTYVPLPNDCTSGDSLNFCGYKGPISTPESSNFGVLRIDHDFASKWHFNGTYHYYHLHNTVSNQWDVGGFFPGDTMGHYSAVRQKPQVPWLYTAGLTTDVSSNVTNNVRFSFTRNFWAYEDPGGVPNVAGYPATLEIGGEQGDVFGPFNSNNQDTRTRFWDGKDTMIGDDLTWLRGNHVFQIGGSFLHNNDTHKRNDNGGTINVHEQYIIGSGSGYTAPLSNYNINMAGYIPSGLSSSDALEYQNLYSMILGMVNETQSLYTRNVGPLLTGLPLKPITSCGIASIAATSDCLASPPLIDDSVIPTYNVYFTDSWHMKPTFSLNFGVGYTVEMPPYSINGGYQTVMVNQQDQILNAHQYLDNVEQSALQGNGYAPLLGFSAIHNVVGNLKYPYNPFYGGITPRIGFAWNVQPNTVIRGGYARIYGRINGVNPILVPMLTPGLMQPASCGGPNLSGGCGGTPLNVFRVGVDCPSSGPCSAPLPPPSASLPQPWYPGLNDVPTAAGETIDPNFHPNRNDEVTLSVQRQLSPKILAEVGYIGRKLTDEIQYYSLTSVPYMMTKGGQTFANAWRNMMVTTDYGYNVPSSTLANGNPNPAFLTYLNSLPAQPFFETAMAGTGYCNGSLSAGLVTGATSCTAAFVGNSAGLMNISDAFDSWGGVSNLGGFNFGRSFTSDPIPGACSNVTTIGCSGQSNSIATTISNGYGNYNGGYLQLTFQDWHGLTMKTNFSYSNALGTGDVVQASSEYASVDPFNLHNDYGPQYYNEKFAFTLFINYTPPFYASQEGLIGHLLGGWTFSPLFTAGSGFPTEMNTFTDCASYGECNPAYVGNYENMVITQNIHDTGKENHASGTICGTVGRGYNVFSNPDASCPINGGTFSDPVRQPILGLDGDISGGGPVTGLPFFNLDLGVSKKIKLNERFNATLTFDYFNVLNHMQPADPCFYASAPYVWGVLGCGGNLQANTPRLLAMGLSFNF